MSTKEAREAAAYLWVNTDPKVPIIDARDAYNDIEAALSELDARRALTQDIRTCAKFTLANSKGYVADAERVLAFLDGCSVTHNPVEEG